MKFYDIYLNAFKF